MLVDAHSLLGGGKSVVVRGVPSPFAKAVEVLKQDSTALRIDMFISRGVKQMNLNEQTHKRFALVAVTPWLQFSHLVFPGYDSLSEGEVLQFGDWCARPCFTFAVGLTSGLAWILDCPPPM